MQQDLENSGIIKTKHKRDDNKKLHFSNFRQTMGQEKHANRSATEAALQFPQCTTENRYLGKLVLHVYSWHSEVCTGMIFWCGHQPTQQNTHSRRMDKTTVQTNFQNMLADGINVRAELKNRKSMNGQVMNVTHSITLAPSHTYA